MVCSRIIFETNNDLFTTLFRANGPIHTSLGRRPRSHAPHKTKGQRPAPSRCRTTTSMPQSLSLNLVHLIFSTKDRMALLTPEIRPQLHAYLAHVARHGDGECYRVGGMADHVHLALRLSRTVALADLVSELKTSSSKWLKEQSPALSKFSWQRGYGAFSIGPKDLESVLSYIDGQEEHHRTRTFQEEYRGFLKHYGIEFDERYVWD